MPDEPDHSPDEVNELVSHVLGLRKDFVQRLLAEGQVASAERNQPKANLRQVLLDAIEDDRLTIERVIAFLDEHEPGGKQHVFLLRPKRTYNKEWTDEAFVVRKLQRRKRLRSLLDASVPLLMPADLTLSSIRVTDGQLEIAAVEARRYYERDPEYDEAAVTEDNLPIELRAYVERVARSTVVLRWDVMSRHAALHITQATSRGVGKNHYREIALRFAEAVAPWLDMTKFSAVRLDKVIHELQRRERLKTNVLTRSRRGSWETDDGSELEATSASVGASLFADKRVSAAVGQVSDADSGRLGNFYWLNTSSNPLTEPLHLTILAADSRVNFMRPSSADAVAHVIEQIRALL